MKKIGIIGAMEIEVAALINAMEAPRTVQKAGMTFYEGRIGAADAVAVRSGVGKVNAAVCAQILIDTFGVSAIINTGAAGSLDNRINIGDFVVSTDVMYHDVDATNFGYAKGEVPQLGIVAFPADEALRALAVSTVKEAAPEQQVFEGRIASGDQFIRAAERKREIIEDTHAVCAEMEGAGIAQAAHINGVPFVVIRAVSDKADESITVAYDDFERKAAAESAAIVKKMLERGFSAENRSTEV